MTYLSHTVVAGGDRPRLRITYDIGSGPVSTVATYTPREVWPCYWFDPATGHYGSGRVPMADTIQIPADAVTAILGLRYDPAPEATMVAKYVRDGRRALAPGQFVTCQPKQRKGTGKTAGVISTITDTGLVTVACGTTTVEVHAEWVQVKNRTRA